MGDARNRSLRQIAGSEGAELAKELQFYLDEYRRYANTERPHQGIAGRTPEEFSVSKPEASVIDLAEFRKRRLERRPYAHGLLQGYALVEDDGAAKAA